MKWFCVLFERSFSFFVDATKKEKRTKRKKMQTAAALTKSSNRCRLVSVGSEICSVIIFLPYCSTEARYVS